MKLTALTTLLICFAIFCNAQQHFAIKGSVTDTMATYKLANTSVTIINQKDSTLVRYSRANADGHFSINNLKAGKFILLLTYPGYADYIEEFALDSSNSVKDFGSVDLILKSTLLEGVIIRGKVAAIKINGDTTEYNAGSYLIKPNSKVEDLLKQLPGIQVDKDGKITAQGQTVNKVLVDGEEFFGDDPTLVTKNLRGDMVDKVQLYDKKSDQSTFTGIDDGEKTKTINIKLKEDKKNGYFGKLSAAGGTKEFYETQAMVNIFKNKEKIAAYGTFGNTGALGLSWQDASKYSSQEGGVVFLDGAGIADFGGGSEMFSGNYDGRGIPSTSSGGLHYENKWNGNKYGLNTNYKLGTINVRGTSNDLSINNLPEGTQTNNSDRYFDNNLFRHKLDASLDIQLDSSSTLRVKMDGTSKNGTSLENFDSYALRSDSTQINKSHRRITNDGNDKIFNIDAIWNKKFSKLGRTLSVNIKQAITNNESDGFLNSQNEFFNESNEMERVEKIDQYKTNKSLNNTFTSNFVYTEPLYKSLSAVFSYGININNATSDRRSFNQDGSGAYTILDEEFSNNFELDQVSNTGGLMLNYKKGKSNVNFGTKLSNVNFNQYDVLTDKHYKRKFTNWNPQVNYSYLPSKQSFVQINYNGRMTQPGISQIQPVRVNTNPLYEILGNPDLEPSFTNSFNMFYSSYKTLTGQRLFLHGSFSFTNNVITNNTETDAGGKTISQTINLSDKTPIDFNFTASSNRSILKTNLGLEASISGSTNYNISNQNLNTAKRMSYGIGPSLSKYTDKFSFYMSLKPTYNTNSSTLQKNINNDGWGASGMFETEANLPGKIQLNVSGNYQYTGKTQAIGNSLSRLILDASISKPFFKDESLRLAFSGKDLLNQNVGFNRSVNNNIINQNSYSTHTC